MKNDVSLRRPNENAVAHKLGQFQREKWVSRCQVATDASIAEALAILDRPTDDAAIAGDELPKGYVSVRLKYAGKSERSIMKKISGLK